METKATVWPEPFRSPGPETTWESGYRWLKERKRPGRSAPAEGADQPFPAKGLTDQDGFPRGRAGFRWPGFEAVPPPGVGPREGNEPAEPGHLQAWVQPVSEGVKRNRFVFRSGWPNVPPGKLWVEWPKEGRQQSSRGAQGKKGKRVSCEVIEMQYTLALGNTQGKADRKSVGGGEWTSEMQESRLGEWFPSSSGFLPSRSARLPFCYSSFSSS